MLPTSTSGGCVSAKSMARATASGEIAMPFSRCPAAALARSSVMELARSVATTPGDTSVTRRFGPASCRSASVAVRTAFLVAADPHRRQNLEAGRRDDVDNMPTALSPEHRQGGGNAVEDAPQIDVDHRVPILDAQRVEARDGGDPSIVDDLVEPPEAFDRARHEGFEIGAQRGVGYMVVRPAASVVQLGCQRGEDAFAPRAEHHGVPAIIKQLRGRPPDAAARTRDRDN